jgi:triacylglycerol esterase/lipase EstA (alpha/beta hydrolase family)
VEDLHQCPMLPTVILPGYLESADVYLPLQQALTALGTPTTTVPLKKRDWLPTLGGRSMIPILRQLDRTVNQALADHQATQINLIGHSAGGWISRIYLGELPYTIHGDVDESVGLWNAKAKIATLITLGTPHLSAERWTRKNLDFVNHNYPGALYPDIKYICVAGKSVYGEKRLGQWLAYSSYAMTCGQGNVWGDGITPIMAAHLAGAINLTIDGVKHSPRTSGIWYGSPEVRSQWIEYLL